jgi:hypothetical protein
MSGDVFYVKQSDTGPSITTTLLDPDGVPVDLTGAAVTFRMVNADATVTGAAAVNSPPTEGQVTYTWDTNDLDVWGGYSLEWVVDQGGVIQTFPSDGYNWVEVIPILTTTLGGICSLMDVRRQLGRSMGDPEAARAVHLIEELTAVLERKLNRKFSPRTVVETHRINSRLTVILHTGPVIDVTAVTVDGSPWDGELADFDIAEFPYESLVEVTYTAGELPDPGVTQLVAQVVARTLLAPTTVAAGTVQSYSVEGTSITYGGAGGNSPGQVGRFTMGDLASLSRLRRPVFLT